MTTIKEGSNGLEVSIAQRLLNKFFGGAAPVLVDDGRFGPKTKYYTQQFQKRMGVTPDGIIGPITWKLLEQGGAVPVTPPQVAPENPVQLMGDVAPFATRLTESMPRRGKYAKGGPLGTVVHFTAGWDGARKTILGGIKNGYTYECIQRNGLVANACPLIYWGYHAGESAWKHLLKKLVGSVSDDLDGIEMNAFGRVDPVKGKPGYYKTYFGHEIDSSEVRYTPGKENQLAGYYHTYTKEQEETLLYSIMWRKVRFINTYDFDFVLGHDEVSGKSGIGYWRKNDPGAALSMTMPAFRELCKKTYMDKVKGKEAQYFGEFTQRLKAKNLKLI